MERIESPRADDDFIEAESVARGLNAPRVTKDELHANIVHEEIVKHVSHSGQVLRWCVLTVANGYAVTGNPSVAVSAANDVPDMGERLARDNAISALWPLMGYELKQRLHAAAVVDKAYNDSEG